MGKIEKIQDMKRQADKSDVGNRDTEDRQTGRQTDRQTGRQPTLVIILAA